MAQSTVNGRESKYVYWSRIGRKACQYALVLFIALTINFSLPRLAPGDPLSYLFGTEVNSLSEEQRDQVNSELGLDRSILSQYADFLAGAFTLELGSSTKFGKPVTEVLADSLPWSLLIIGPALLLSPFAGILFGAYAAWHRAKRRDIVLLVLMLTMEAMPVFWAGMLLIAIFSVQLGWLPSYGAVPLIHPGNTLDYGLEVLRRMVLPVITITFSSIGTYFLMTRFSMLDTLGQDYMTMAEAKGVRPRRLLYGHALRNALLPVYTHFTMSLGILLGGAVIVETVFSYPGIGRLLYESVIARDYPMMQGVFLMITVGVIIANLLADLTYPLVDPRVRTRRALEAAR
ncbi:ABC transporter permease [Cohnella faecalis]|uniref:ABC transporter permease n=1 Tax=Cohnella faecalis TaxID=2315694 RepID=A0A398CVY7_9BACL|nr:ABC transporter permease [Cohnella faecalis]RIE04047.1 ABC transporter permease [Cohnella faecalis]